MVIILISAFSVWLFLLCSGRSPLESESTFAEQFQEALDHGRERYHGMGASATVTIPGFEPWIGVSGVSQDSVLITSEILFSIGSVTKSFMAALVLKLAEEGLLTLKDSLHT